MIDWLTDPYTTVSEWDKEVDSELTKRVFIHYPHYLESYILHAVKSNFETFFQNPKITVIRDY